MSPTPVDIMGKPGLQYDMFLDRAYRGPFHWLYADKNNYAFLKRYLRKTMSTYWYSPVMFIDDRDVIDHVISYPVNHITSSITW